jgi:hypothetical protein
MENNIKTLEKRADNAQILGRAVGLLRILKSTPNIGLTGTFHQIDQIIDELDKIEL